jgi:hypothetical protein
MTMTTTITAMPATVPSSPAIKTFSMARRNIPRPPAIYRKQGMPLATSNADVE